MKQLTIATILLVAVLATAGQLRHPKNPLTVAGAKIDVVTHDWPPPCYPHCPPAKPPQK